MRFKLFLVTLIFLTGCIKAVNLTYRTPPPTPVVQGLLLTDSTPCQVILSYSGIFGSEGSQVQNFIKDATVYLHDDAGDSVQLTNEGNGNYLDAYSQMIAQADRSYFITINLSNGGEYASVPEKIVPVPKVFELDSIGTALPPGLPGLFGAEILIKTQDPANETNYYRWISTDYVPRKAYGVPCPPNQCEQYCYQQYTDDSVRILSDADINGSEIRYQNVLVSPYYYYGTHFIEIKQLSLTPQAYRFWQLYQEQTTRTGSILDPLPSSLQGNIYNRNDTTQLALGYFEASDASSLKLIIAPLFLNAYYTLSYAAMYVYPGVGACWNVYPNAYEYAPPGWENIQQIIYDVY